MTQAITYKKLFRIQLWAVVLGVLLLLAKFFAYMFTHSNTILTDALESVINVIAGAFALYSLHLSSLPKDDNHPYGHGKVEFISAGFEGILIIIAGGLIIGKAAFAFFHPHELEHLDVGLAIILFSGLFNFILGFVLEKYGKQHGSLILTADGAHLKSDAYSSIGIGIGVLIILFSKAYVLDNIVAILAGAIITYTGIKLVRRSVAGIMDEADEAVILSVIKLLNENRKPAWIDVHNLRIIQYGNKLHIDCHTTLPWYFTLEEAHNEMEEMAQVINEKHSAQVEFFIHGDPCIPTSCKICTMQDCKVRTEQFKQLVEWNMENVIANKKHGL